MSTPTPPQDGAALAAIRAKHRCSPSGNCAACLWLWPCPTAVVLAALDASEAHNARLTTWVQQQGTEIGLVQGHLDAAEARRVALPAEEG